MLRELSLLLGSATLLAACSGGEASPTLNVYGEYLAVPEHWAELTDNVEGPHSFLTYRSKDYVSDSALYMSCEEARPKVFIASGQLRPNPMTLPARITMKIDANDPKMVDFLQIAGRLGLQPGDGGAEDARDFMESISGAKRPAVQYEIAGIRLTDQPTFDLTGIDAVLHNLELACASQS